MIPSAEECYEFMKKYGMFDHIKAHSIVVEKIASVITKSLRDKGVDVSLETVTAGALMHDIGKTICIKSGGDHAAVGEDICLENDLVEIADIVGEHVTLKIYQLDGLISEKEIVHYADKRVNHDKVVSLEERLKYIFERYGKNKEHLFHLIKENFDRCRIIEKKLFAQLEYQPEALAGMVE